MSRPLLLDLCCKAGGAAEGYYRAGFEVIGFDVERQPHYPFEFVRDDALTVLKDLVTDTYEGLMLDSVAAIHASPPCQTWSAATAPLRKRGKTYPALIEPLRFLLRRTGLPYVIENVAGSPLVNPVMLCGSRFGLRAELDGYGIIGTHRHRLFEANFPILDPGPCVHEGYTNISICGHEIQPHQRRRIGRGVPVSVCREVMGIDWMNRDELSEAVPPAYTEYIGRHLMTYLEYREAA